jgi:DNA polymerase elongation subunit (family B)
MENKQYIKVFRNGNTLVEIYKNNTNEKIYKKHKNFECEFFVPGNTGSTFKDLVDKIPLQRIKCDGFFDFKTKKENYNGIKTTHGSIQPEKQFMYREYYKKPLVSEIETCFFDIETGFDGASLDEENNLVYGSGFPKPERAEAPITSIACYSSTRKRYVVFSLKNLDTITEPLIHNAKLIVSDTEEQMLELFFSLMKKWDVDVLIGWNTNGFDFPFIVNRMVRLGMDINMIDHMNLVRENKLTKVLYPRSYYWLDYMDIYKTFTYVPRESYSLQAIAEAEIGGSKIQYHDDGNLQEIYNNNYRTFLNYNIQDVALLVELDAKTNLSSLAYNMSYLYNVNFDEVLGTTGPWTQLLFCETRSKDLILPDKRESEEMGFEGGHVFCNPGYYEWVVSFDFASLYPSLIRAYNFCPSTYIREKDLPTELKSIRSELKISDTYEGIEAQLNFSTEQKERLSNLLKKYEVSMSPSGHFFSIKEQGIFPYLMEKIYKERKAAKKLMTQAEIKLKELITGGVCSEEQRMMKERYEKDITVYNNKQMSLKICLNSAYGAFSSSYFLLSRKAIGESITSGGRLADRKAGCEVDKVLTEKFDYSKTNYKSSVVCQDTDSCYFGISPIIEKNCSKTDDLEKVTYINTKIVPVIEKVIKNKALSDISETYNLLDRTVLDMEHEVIAKYGIYVGKKNYILSLVYKEGVTYPEGKEKVVGLQIKKTNLPAFVRKKMKEFTKIMFEKDEPKFQKEFAKFKKEFMDLPVSDISFPKGLNLETDKDRGGCTPLGNGRFRYTLKSVGCPAHVKAALRYNEYITKNNLLGKYNIIEGGTKIKFVYLQNDESMGFPNDRQHQTFIEDNNFSDLVDYKKMFEGIVVKPLEPLVLCLGWSFEKRFKITDFM